MKRARIYQLRHIAKGLCPQCGKPDPDKRRTLCLKCRDAFYEKRRTRMGWKPWHQGGRGRPPTVTKPVVTETAETTDPIIPSEIGHP